jgi:ABC-type methionine transport system permease subunit
MKESLRLEVEEGSIEAAKLMAISTGQKSYRAMLSEYLEELLAPYRSGVSEIQEKEYARSKSTEV